MPRDSDTGSWSEEEFSGAALGNKARTRRLVRMADAASQRPAGKVVEVFVKSNEREAAYRFVESRHANYLSVGSAAHAATFRRAEGRSVVLVVLDGSSLSLLDSKEGSAFGPIGNKWASTRGAQVMSAIAVTSEGEPLGPAGQVYWTRPKRPRKSRKDSYGEGRRRPKRYRPIEDKESRHWGTVLDQVLDAKKAANFEGRIWFQLDAGADFFEMLAIAPTLDDWMTIRVARDNRNMWEPDTVLSDVMAKAPLQGTYELKVSPSSNRAGRLATIEVRASLEVVALRRRADHAPIPCPLHVVRALETSEVPDGEEPIEWLLFTTRPVTTMADALEVIDAYSKRWRIEECHKAWKSVTKIEESALESEAALYVWATILFSVALRIERLKYLSRGVPTMPATAVLTLDEIEAIHILKETPAKVRDEMMTISTAVRCIAELGGYTSAKSSGGPPGTITIGRGLKRVTDFAAFLPQMRRKR
jgi:Transposase DNA-binding/Transposase Tn5 dimerisation domain